MRLRLERLERRRFQFGHFTVPHCYPWPDVAGFCGEHRRALIKDSDRRARLAVFPGRHPSVADDTNPSGLYGTQPASVYCREYVAGINQGQRDDILDARLQIGGAASRHLNWLAIKHPIEDCYVVRGQIVGCVHIVSNRTKVCAERG